MQYIMYVYIRVCVYTIYYEKITYKNLAKTKIMRVCLNACYILLFINSFVLCELTRLRKIKSNTEPISG